MDEPSCAPEMLDGGLIKKWKETWPQQNAKSLLSHLLHEGANNRRLEDGCGRAWQPRECRDCAWKLGPQRPGWWKIWSWFSSVWAPNFPSPPALLLPFPLGHLGDILHSSIFSLYLYVAFLGLFSLCKAQKILSPKSADFQSWLIN